ncbi:MAG: hypothetical protein WC869_16520 [Phycisphaerae bacterium]|jgi:hypothetical protein
MNRMIQVRRRADVPLINVYEGVNEGADLNKYKPTYLCTRIWMGVVPPDGPEPGYACVLGEMFDPNLEQRQLSILLMDEGIALDPADFSAGEKRRYRIPENNRDRPTKRRLAQAVVALKDIYWPQMVFVPTTVGSTVDLSQQGSSFTQFLRMTDGLIMYDSSLGYDTSRRWFPFYSSSRRTVDGIREVPHEDRDYNLSLIDSLYEAKTFKVNRKHCKIYLEQKLPNARRCVGMLLAQMELSSPPVRVRTFDFGDGYALPVNDPELEGEADEMLAVASRRQWRDDA